MRRNAFSLVELSISLVIIGLIVGGVMTGSSLIRNSEVKTVITEYNKYKEAALSFRTKYAGLPGDLSDATNYWASAANGDGDGRLDWAAGANLPGEFAQFWLHLSLAGLIEGEYTGLSGPGADRHIVPGTNAPKATLTNAGWGTFYQGFFPGDAANFSYDYGNVLVNGGEVSNNWNWTSSLKPEEAWNIDMKIDDGMPGAGFIITTNRTTCANATSVTDYAATYRLDGTSKVCTLYFTNPY